MSTDTREAVRAAFPEVASIEDDDLRATTVDAWATAMEETGIDDLHAMPWYPPEQEELGVPNDAENLVDHVRDVTAGSVALAEVLAKRRDPGLSLDVVIAGALIHDISKLYEFGTDGSRTEFWDMLGHPYYGVHLAARAGLPLEVSHIVLSHSGRTNVEPATLAAEIVCRVDWAAAAAITSERLGEPWE